MSLQQQLTDFATRSAVEDKALRVLLNGNKADLADLTTSNKTSVVAALNALQTALNNLAATSGAVIADGSTATSSTWSSTKIAAQITAATAAIINSSPAALDTLQELATALGNDSNFAASTATALGKRVRFDAAQTLTAPEKTQALANIGGVAATAVGNTELNLVTVFEAALV